ncbi:MAG: hypothetical protein IJT66_03040 [Clostridia bacterium]|nr:hypothetical protein [Clostridia bacterium]
MAQKSNHIVRLIRGGEPQKKGCVRPAVAVIPKKRGSGAKKALGGEGGSGDARHFVLRRARTGCVRLIRGGDPQKKGTKPKKAPGGEGGSGDARFFVLRRGKNGVCPAYSWRRTAKGRRTDGCGTDAQWKIVRPRKRGVKKVFDLFHTSSTFPGGGAFSPFCRHKKLNLPFQMR